MYLPPLQPVVNSKILIYGDVEIHPSASVAQGVILQAAPESRIVIGADACIGMGVVLKAYGGVIEVESGATLGAGVLIIGKSTIGSNCCVGTSTTIFNASVESMKVITPGTILGDTSRYVDNSSLANSSHTSKSQTKFSNTTTTSKGDSQTTAVSEKLPTEKKRQQQNHTVIKSQIKEIVNGYFSDDKTDPWAEEKAEERLDEAITTIQVEEVAENIKPTEKIAIGKVYIDQLLVTLFPHKKPSHNSSSSNLLGN